MRILDSFFSETQLFENTPNYGTTRDYTKLKSDDITKVRLPVETLVKTLVK